MQDRSDVVRLRVIAPPETAVAAEAMFAQLTSTE
jgi:hypothetical protein